VIQCEITTLLFKYSQQKVAPESNVASTPILSFQVQTPLLPNKKKEKETIKHSPKCQCYLKKKKKL
jgi:hypothetical protein